MVKLGGMHMYVVKRDCELQEFDRQKIFNAIMKAMKAIGIVKPKIAEDISYEIEQIATESETDLSVSDIEELVFDKLISKKQRLTARAYEGYRAIREFQREVGTIDDELFAIINGTDVEIKDNSNKNTALVSTMRDLAAEKTSKDLAFRYMLPPDIVSAHMDGLIYIHDLGHYINPSFNCCLVNLEDMLQNGTVINGKMITKPKSFRTACTVATQIVAQVASGQFGGQTISLAHLAPFVRISKERIIKEVEEEIDLVLESISDDGGFRYKETVDKIVSKRLHQEIKDGIQTFQYQINTLQTSNGQAPFLSIFMYISENPEYEEETAMLIEEMLKQRIKGMQNKVGAWISPAFPKLLFVTDENNIHPQSKYYYLTELAAKCVVNRMMPDFLSAKLLKKYYEGNVVPPMGCRAFLSPYKGGINNKEGEYKLWGRFNLGLTSINLADAGLSAEGDLEEFWNILDERLELCHKSLLLRYEKLKNITSDVSPIHWQYGAIARLKEHELIYPLLQNGYATITLGYIGVYECVMALIGKSHTTPEGEKLALQIVQKLKDTTLEWKKQDGLGWALYGTPSESLTDRFARLTRARWGEIKGITDRNFLTNSYHVFVKEPIDAFDKLTFESQFEPISSGGHIIYIEMPNMKANPEAVLEVIKFMYDHTQYAEFNTKLDYCMECGYDGEMLCDDGLNWYCPNCGNRDTDRMTIVRRTCGYLGENLWNEGRTEEIANRYIHLDNHKVGD